MSPLLPPVHNSASVTKVYKKTYSAVARLNWQALGCQLISVLLIYALLLQLTPRVAIAAGRATPKAAPVANETLKSERGSTPDPGFSMATGAVESSFASEPAIALLPVPTPTPANGIAIVRHASLLNGSGRVEGSLRQLTGESVTLNGGAVITNDLQVPGTPTLLLNGTPTFGGTIQGTGSAQPTNYQVTLNGISTTVLGHLVNRTDPLSLPSVPAPPASTGTRSVTITAAGQSAGNFATLKDLTLNGNVGMYTIPAGTYRNFIANAGSGFMLGVSGATQPAVYNMSSLTLNGSAQFQVIGPVILNLGGALMVNAAMGSSSNPAWLKLQITTGGVTLNSGSLLNAMVNAPASTVIINASSQLVGTLTCDRLTVNGGGLLRLTENAVNQAPIVNSGGNKTITLPSGASLSGSASDDGLPIGSTLTTTWTKVSGPGTVTFANASSPVTTATFSQAGTYVLRLTGSDSQLTSTSDATITVLPQNFPPAVSAGPDKTITQPSSVTLNGSAADDGLPAGGSLSLLWTKVSGPGNVTFTNPTAAVTNASFSGAGPYVLRLTASDSQLSSYDEVNVTVNPQNQAPNVNAGADQSITLPSSAVLHGTVTDDGLPTGSSVTVTWSKLSGPGTVNFTSPNNVNTNASFSVAGDYTLQLTASDTLLSNHDEVIVYVAPQNHAPTVNAGTNQTITLPASANLNGSVSDDGLPSGSTVTTTWSKVSGPGTVTFGNANVTVTTATFSTAGSFVLRLTASDSDLSDHADVTITAIAQNHTPTVNAGANQTITLPGSANLNGSATDDGLPAGSTLTTTWTKVSGPGTVTFGNANTTATTAAFSDAGTYVLRLTASDSDLSNSAEVQVIVVAENHAPTANAGTDQTINLPNTASLNGSASDDGLPAGSSLTTTWTKVSGPGAVTFGNAHVTVTTAAFSEAGPYVLRLTANDSVLTASDDVEITVIAENHAPTANAGNDQTITLPANANLNGSASDDGLPAGSTLTTTWTKVSGPGIVSFGNSHAVSTSATFSVAGAYTLRLTATDSQLSAFDEVIVTVDPQNQAPTVNGGSDQTINLPAIANLNGSVSDDGLPVGSSVTTTWSKVSGPGSVTFGNANVTVTTASFSAPGSYVLKLSATDTELTGEATLTVYANATNQAPAANAGTDQALTLPSNSVSLSGNVHDDGLPAGASVNVLWTLVSAVPVQSPAFFGDNFNDNNLDTSKWTAELFNGAQIAERNSRLEFQPSTLQFGGGQFRSVGYVDAREHVVTFKYGGHDQASSAQTTFNVHDDGGSTNLFAIITGTSIQFFGDFSIEGERHSNGVFLYDGSAPVWLRWRQLGISYFWETSPDGVNWTLSGSGKYFQTPTGSQYFRFDFSEAPGGPAVYIDDFAVTSPAWDAKAGPGTVTFDDAASAATVAHFSGAGEYVLRLTASDSEFTSIDDLTVTVNPPNDPPLVDAGKDQTILLSQAATLRGSVPDEGLPAGSTVTSNWSVVSGPGAVVFAAPGDTATTATFSVVGYYVLRLTASDSELTGSDDITIRVVDSYDVLPGGIFVSGHDSDGHAGGEHDGALIFMAAQIIQRAIGYVSYDKPNPRILLVTDLRNPGADNGDPRQGLRNSGFHTFDVADYGSGQEGALDVHSVNFSNYDVVFVASSYGGWLRQDELDILNTRRAELIDFVNNGGGLVALAESGGRLAPDSNYPGVTYDQYRFLPLYVSSVQLQEDETGSTLTTEGEAAGLTLPSISANSTENYFTTTAGMGILDLSAANHLTTLGLRGRHISSAGLGNDAPIVGAGADRTITMPNAALLSGVASDDGLPAGSGLSVQWSKVSGPGNVTFENSQQAETHATFDAPGTYQLKLTATDGELASYAEMRVLVNPTGQLIVVNAGVDQILRLPNTAGLNAIVTDGRASTVEPFIFSWTRTSGPGTVSFSNPAAPATTVSFVVPGVYVLRFAAGDSGYTASDELTVYVRPQPAFLSDDFNDNTPDPAKWIYGPGVSERDQQLQVDVPDAASLTEFLSVNPVDLTADGAQIQFEIPDYADASLSNNRIIYWRMQASEGHWFQWVYRSGGIDIYLDNIFLARNFGAPRFWRLTHFTTNNRVNYDVSDDGVNWSNRYSLVGPFSFTLDAVTFRLIIGAQGAGAAGTVKLDNVNCNAPSNAANHPPTPVPGGPYQTTVGVPLQFDGSGSYDAGDIIVNYTWDFGDGLFDDGPTPTHTYAAIGAYTARLTVSDPEGASGSTTTGVNVTVNQVAPVADFTVPERAGLVHLVTTAFSSYNVDCCESYHPRQLLDGTINSFWQSAAGQTVNQSLTFRPEPAESVLIDRVRLQNRGEGLGDVKDFDVQVSNNTESDSDFVTVLSGTLQLALHSQPQQFVFPGGPVPMRYVRLLAKTTWDNANFMRLATFDVFALGTADGIVSLLGEADAARDGSPALLKNGGSVYKSSHTFGLLTPNGMLDYSDGAPWETNSITDQYAIIQLAGSRLYTLDGVKLATIYASGYGYPKALKDFEVWVSATTPDESAFTKVLAATVAFNGEVQSFAFPGGSVQARYVKYVPLTNWGGHPYSIATMSFDVIAEEVGRVVDFSSELGDTSIAEAAFDDGVNTWWYTRPGNTENQWVKVALAGAGMRKVYGVVIDPAGGTFNPEGPKDFEIRVSTTTSDDSAFTTVYSGTLAEHGRQELHFNDLVDARYIEFFWRNGYSPYYVGVSKLQVLSAPEQGAALVATSSWQDTYSAGNALDIDTISQPWVTDSGHVTDQWFKLLLAKADLWTIDHVALQPGLVYYAGFPDTQRYPRDFEVQVSTTDSNDSSFSTVVAGTLQQTTDLQHFYFPPTPARYIKLLLKNNYGSNWISLNAFFAYTPNQGSTDARFADRSTDADGHIVAWAWNFGDGGTSTEQSPLHHYAAPGDYTVTLNVTDNSGLSSSHQLLYHAVASLAPEFAFSPVVIHEGGENVRFTDTTQVLLQPSALRTWDFGNGSAPSTFAFATTHYIYPDSGHFSAKLMIGDEQGLAYVATKQVEVLNVAPSVTVEAGKTVFWGEPWTNAPQMSDPSSVDSQSLTGVWDFADGHTTQCPNCNNTSGVATHTYDHPGVYNATLTVTDKDGGVGVATAVYTANKHPTAFVLQNPPAQTTGAPLILHAQLRDTFTNQILPGKPVQFSLNSASFNATTDSNGIAEVSVQLPAGTRIDMIIASFAEDEYYASGSGVTVTTAPLFTPPSGTPRNQGTNFWLMFPPNLDDQLVRVRQTLFIASTVDTTGLVTIPGLNFSQSFTVAANTVATVQLGIVQVVDSDIVQSKGIHVTSEQPVTVYGLNQKIYTSDAYLGLPVNALGTDYVVLAYGTPEFPRWSEFGLVAAENGTIVTITPKVTIGARLAGVPYDISLNQGQTYLLYTTGDSNDSDLSGSLINSNKPIAVFAGHLAANLTPAFCCADHLVEQLTPTSVWGKRFATMPLATRTKGDFFRFVAAEDGTAIYLNGQLTATLNRGEFAERIIKDPTEIIATRPIMVGQFSTSVGYDMPATGRQADPFYMIIPPYSQFLNHYNVVALGDSFEYNFANVIAPTASLGSITVDGVAIPAASFVPVGLSGYSGARIPLGNGSHTLDGPASFGISVYGYSVDEGYGYPGGMNLAPIVNTVNVTIAPETSAHDTHTQGCVVATANDQNQTPLGGTSVSFTVTGVNPANSAIVTDAAGQATLCYVGSNSGTDQIVAAIGSVQASASIVWSMSTSNQPPVVNAGADQTVSQLAANLAGSITDDGLPTGTLTASWSKVSGPGSVVFANPNAAATSVTFATPGVYVLRLTGSDTILSASDDVQLSVSGAPVNQPPIANAGPDQTVSLNANLVVNGGSDDTLVNGEIPGWTEVDATTWTQGSANSGAGFPPTQRGNAYFYSGNPAQAELRQDIDLTAYAQGIAAGTQQFELHAYLRSAAEALPDTASVVLEYRNATNTATIATLNTGEVTSTTGWNLTEDTRAVPPGTGWVRIRLIATRNPNAAGDAGNDAFFDSVSFRPLGAAAVKLSGIVTDDGLPSGSTVSANWNFVSGLGAVQFSTPNAAVSSATFTTAGTYVLRLTSSDGQANASDDVSVFVNPANQPPVVNAGANQTITLPATATLNGSVTDDGQPSGSSVSVTWSKLSGPGVVTVGNAHQATTTASFSVAGTYVLRLTADDTEYDASADVTITVNAGSGQVNQPPVVNPGPNQTISLPTDTVTLNGTATDDGLPVGSTLTVTWTKVSGPGVVTFGSPNTAITTAQFSAVGSYVLRLSASDGAYLVSADVGVILTPENLAPTANAGPDQAVLLSIGAQLDGSASDDGYPVGNLSTVWSQVSGPGTVTFLNPNVTITGAQFSAIGTYVLRLTASDGALTSSDDISITVNDNVAPPTVEITAPTDGSSVTEPTIVTGSVSGGAWVLEYSLDSDDNANNRVWTQFANGNGAISNGTLGYLDPTMMLNGLFDIRLSATDDYGQTSRATIAVIVERNLKIGNFTVSFSDLNIPVAGVPMEVTRTYDTRDKRVGDFGFGWTLGLHNIRVEKARVIGLKWFETRSNDILPSYCLQSTGSHLVTVTFPGGKVFKFEASASSHCQIAPIDGGTLTFTPLPGTHGTLEIVGSAAFAVEGSIPGPVNLVSVDSGVDIFNSSLFKFTAEDGAAFVIDQRAGLQSLQDTNNNTVTVSAGGIIHSNGKSITFNRDSLGRITSVIDPAGNPQTYTYDTAGNLVSYTDAEHNTSTYTYDATHRLLTIHDPRGVQPIRNDYDADGRLISHTDGFGKVITYIHDIVGRTETITDRLGHPTTFEYDERGNVLSKTDARAGVTSFTYDANDNVLTETNALGKTTTYTYDANDHRASITDPLSHVTQFTYNAQGKVLTTTDPLGHVTTNTYNGAGNLLTTKDALDNTTSFTYSIFDGQRSSTTDALNNTTSYAYTNGYLTKETDALGHETTFSYDAGGNRASQTVKRTNAQGQLETITASFEYDNLNRVTKTTFADGSFTQVEYNSIGQQHATVDQLGARTEFTYDDMGRLTRTDYPDGTHDETTYDAEGRRLTSKDRAGHITSFAYDELGRLTRTTYPDNTFTSTTYDAAGQVLATTDARGNVTHYEYDNAGRRTKVRNALNQETTFAYDAGGNQLSMTDALSHTTSYEYDLNNRGVKTIYADSSFDTVGYDAAGRSVSKTDQAGKTTQFTYDALGRLSKVKDALNQETTYGYNEIGQQVSQTDANSHTTRFEYDQLGRRVKRILPGGQFEAYTYNNGGNLDSKTDFNGHVTTFTYDVMRRLLSKVPDGSLNQPTVSFTYNLLGQRATMNDASGATIYSYDARNRLASRQTPFGTLSYTYTEAGGLLTTRSSNPNGVSVDYSYDALNRLGSVKDNNLLGINGGVTDYTYDTVGNLQSYSYPNGVTSSYAFNSLNRLTTMTVGTANSSLASYAYTLGAAGNRTFVTELSGRTLNYTYDDLYRLTNESIGNDPHGINGSVSYDYDPVSNRVNRSSSIAGVPSQTSTYDADDRLNSDSYDNNGNTTSANSNSYAYDFENRLTSLNGSSVTYIYDGDGNRVAKTVGGFTTTYLVDTNNPTGYAQVVAELQSGAVVKSFTYGHDLISQRIVGGSLSFYQYDGHGSVRLLTDVNATGTDTYDYDAFGNLISHTGTTSNDYLYAGEQFDANLGFYYLRARYLNQSSGRFSTMDDNAGDNLDPLTLHKYLYVGNNPVNAIDPTGRCTLAELEVTLSIGEVLGAEAALTLGTAESALAAGFAGETAVAATITAGSSGLTTLTTILAFGGASTVGYLLGAANQPGGPPQEREPEQEEEIFYRIMSAEERNGLGPRGEIAIRDTENFVTQNYGYVISLAAKRPQDYQHLVVYNMQRGTRNALLGNGAVSNVNGADFPEVAGLRHISSFPKNEPNIVHVKGESGGLNFGLRRGTAGIFNSRIISARGYVL